MPMRAVESAAPRLGRNPLLSQVLFDKFIKDGKIAIKHLCRNPLLSQVLFDSDEKVEEDWRYTRVVIPY